jgi:hypothetical protein
LGHSRHHKKILKWWRLLCSNNNRDTDNMMTLGSTGLMRMPWGP